jgi:hypothetical protein
VREVPAPRAPGFSHARPLRQRRPSRGDWRRRERAALLDVDAVFRGRWRWERAGAGMVTASGRGSGEDEVGVATKAAWPTRKTLEHLNRLGKTQPVHMFHGFLRVTKMTMNSHAFARRGKHAAYN